MMVFDPALVTKDLSKEEWKYVLLDVLSGTSRLTARLVSMEIAKAIASEDVFTKALSRIAGKIMEKAVTPYISAAVLLILSTKEVTEDSVAELLKIADIEPSKRYMNFVSRIKPIEDIGAYSPTLYYVMVTGNKLEASTLTKVLGAMGMKPQDKTSEYVIETYNSMVNNKKIDKSSIEERLEDSIMEASGMISKVMGLEVDRIFEMEGMDERIRRGFIPYLSAAGVLAYLGFDIAIIGEEKFRAYEKNLIDAVGINADNEMLDFVIKSLRMGLFPYVYISAIYFLKGIGIKITVEKMMDIAKILGAPRDEAAAQYILSMYAQYTGSDAKTG